MPQPNELSRDRQRPMLSARSEWTAEVAGRGSPRRGRIARGARMQPTTKAGRRWPLPWPMPRRPERRRSPAARRDASVLLATGLLRARHRAVRRRPRPATRCARASATARPPTRPRSSPTSAETGRSTGGYATRQSNLSRSGGGAIYGCRSTRRARGTNPCLRANNLSTGSAFEFNAPERRRRRRVSPPARAATPSGRSRPTRPASPPASTPTASTARTPRRSSHRARQERA